MTAFSSPGLDRLRRRRQVRRIVLLVALLALLVLSALLWPKQRADALAVPTTDGRVTPSGVLSGRLTAEQEGDRVCYRVDAASGPAVLVFPSGWAADPRLGLLDPSGVVVAPRGSSVRITGDPGAIGSAPGCSATGRVWGVSDVRTV